VSDYDDDDDDELVPLVEGELDDDEAYARWVTHPLGAYLVELAAAHISTRDDDGEVFVGKLRRDSGIIEFFAADAARQGRIDQWLLAEQRRGTGLRGQSRPVPMPTRDQWAGMQSAARVRRKRTSRPPQPARRTSRPALPATRDRSDKSDKED
jgi:hypothetical protein